MLRITTFYARCPGTMCLYAASQEIDFDDELRKAVAVSFQETGGNDRQSPFFLSADRKAQVLMAGCQNWKAQSLGATVC